MLTMLINAAFNSGALQVEDDGKDLKLITKKLGATLVLAKLSKEAIYQMSRKPEDPPTLADAIVKLKTLQQERQNAAPEPEKSFADDPVPLPRPVRQKPQLQLIQGGAA